MVSPKTQFLDWDTTASNNTDINNIGILGTNAVNNFDDALRTMMAQLRRDIDGRIVYTTKSGNYTAVANDNNAFLRFSAAATLTLTAAATLGANWHILVIANGGDVVIDPNASETIDGKTTLTVRDGSACLVICDGTNFRTNLAADQRTTKGYLYGLTLSNNGSDATNDIDIAVGEAASDGTIPYLMALGTALTKRLDAVWAVGTNQGGLDTGSIANGTYHVWLIQRSDTGVVDALFSTSATSPTMPANYDRKRRIGSILREAAAIVGFYQRGDLFRRVPNATPDYNSTASRATALLTVSVPTGIVVRPVLSTILATAGASGAFSLFGSANAGNVENQWQSLAAAQSEVSFMQGVYLTNTSAQLYFAVTISLGTLVAGQVSAVGWFDDRGRI